ncbi:MAG: ATP-binding protein [Acaryochloris sp. RU_4_1]|nr:ATP-binding protein [Acaryochloris sp. SU_5_25]NJM66983.1 ATP-binding protein [Acaryochloris sp. RU_4_1]NJR55855.1 ATP-binding protein [Acaryochloris sp. CRU_2_0]
MTIETFGQLLDNIPDSQEYLTLNFAPTSAPQRQQRWHNNGLSADFLGDYFATFFPGGSVSESEVDLKGTVKATVSYIANELLENAFKYSDELVSLPITITLRLYDREILFQVTNYANQGTAQGYRAFVQKIETTDLEELYTQQLEQTALGEGGSCLGILTIIHDYAAKAGWKFESVLDYPSLLRVSVIVRLVV